MPLTLLAPQVLYVMQCLFSVFFAVHTVCDCFCDTWVTVSLFYSWTIDKFGLIHEKSRLQKSLHMHFLMVTSCNLLRYFLHLLAGSEPAYRQKDIFALVPLVHRVCVFLLSCNCRLKTVSQPRTVRDVDGSSVCLSLNLLDTELGGEIFSCDGTGCASDTLCPSAAPPKCIMHRRLCLWASNLVRGLLNSSMHSQLWGDESGRVSPNTLAAPWIFLSSSWNGILKWVQQLYGKWGTCLTIWKVCSASSIFFSLFCFAQRERKSFKVLSVKQ